jgi:hypothetical protein
MNIEEYKHLWQPGFAGNVLIRVDAGGSGDVQGLVIFDPQDRTVLLIDDEDVENEVVRRMLEAGAPVLDSVPPEAQRE